MPSLSAFNNLFFGLSRTDITLAASMRTRIKAPKKAKAPAANSRPRRRTPACLSCRHSKKRCTHDQTIDPMVGDTSGTNTLSLRSTSSKANSRVDKKYPGGIKGQPDKKRRRTFNENDRGFPLAQLGSFQVLPDTSHSTVTSPPGSSFTSGSDTHKPANYKSSSPIATVSSVSSENTYPGTQELLGIENAIRQVQEATEGLRNSTAKLYRKYEEWKEVWKRHSGRQGKAVSAVVL